MVKSLQQYFPQIRTQEKILKEIQETPFLKTTYEKWNEEQQKLFLEICSGMRGVKILYDSFF